MVALTTLFQQNAPLKVLVAGDLLLDRYTVGAARRISPESPVPVINVQREEQRAGGAGNVMLNLRALGANVVALGRVGPDSAGEQLQAQLKGQGIDTSLLVTDQVPTPVKQRIIAQGQQLVRVDRETVVPLGEKAEKELISKIPELMEWCQVVAVSDYAKGTLSDTILRTLIEEARFRGIPVIIDPKGLDYSKYAHATLLKPNLLEAYAVTGSESGVPLEEVAQQLQKLVAVDTLMITRSADGISFWEEGKAHHSAAQVREVVDVTGAGDTVLASIALALGYGLSTKNAAELANIAAGIAVEHIGCACITMAEIAQRILALNSSSKMIPEEQHNLLKEALAGQAPTVFSIDTANGFDQDSYARLQNAKKEGKPCLVCCIDAAPSSAVVDLLTSLQEVDYLIAAPESFVHDLAPETVQRLDLEPCLTL